MAAPRLIERTAHLLLAVAARRWPPDLATFMRAEWAAELACLRGHPWQMLTFAGSLATANPPGATHATRAAATTAAALVVLLAAALFNGVRAALHSVETTLPWSGEATLVGALLVASILAMALAGARWAPRRPLPAAALFGLCAYAFLLAGNETAVMPFMGWRDVTPAVLTWTALTMVTTGAVLRLRRAGHHRSAAVTALTGGLLAVESAAVTGCLHAAQTLGVPLTTAPAWFPLSMLPGGTGGFGPLLPGGPSSYFPDGHVAAAALDGTGLAVHASDILLAGAATLTGPLLLCTAFLTAALLQSTRPERTSTALPQSSAFRPGPWSLPPWARAFRNRSDPRITAGATTAALVLLAAELLPRSTTVAELAFPRVVDNSTVFGFGFLAHPAGRATLAFAVALLAVHQIATRRPRPTP